MYILNVLGHTQIMWYCLSLGIPHRLSCCGFVRIFFKFLFFVFLRQGFRKITFERGKADRSEIFAGHGQRRKCIVPPPPKHPKISPPIPIVICVSGSQEHFSKKKIVLKKNLEIFCPPPKKKNLFCVSAPQEHFSAERNIHFSGLIV